MMGNRMKFYLFFNFTELLIYINNNNQGNEFSSEQMNEKSNYHESYITNR